MSSGATASTLISSGSRIASARTAHRIGASRLLLRPLYFTGFSRAGQPSRCALLWTAFADTPTNLPILETGTPSAHNFAALAVTSGVQGDAVMRHSKNRPARLRSPKHRAGRELREETSKCWLSARQPGIPLRELVGAITPGERREVTTPPPARVMAPRAFVDAPIHDVYRGPRNTPADRKPGPHACEGIVTNVSRADALKAPAISITSAPPETAAAKPATTTPPPR